jgi:CRISPR-associated protein Cas1
MAAIQTVLHSPQNHNSTAIITPRHGVVTLFGYGIRVQVERGHLVLEDGIGADRRHARFARVGHGLRRLVVIGADGMVSLAALRWLADQDAALVMLDRNGKVLISTGRATSSDARLRRAQACAEQYGVDFLIARELIHQKLLNQEKISTEKLLDPFSAREIANCRKELHLTSTIESIRQIESIGAKAYWQAWRSIPVEFLRSDVKRVPAHWKTFGTRVSPLTNSPRLAVNPANAILNYLYAILEAESRLAAAKMGLDPGLGILHLDDRLRDSLACDLMEPVRPKVDEYLFDWISKGILRRAWFFEEGNGNCRLMGEFAQRFSETSHVWAHAVAPIAEQVTETIWLATRQKFSIRLPAARLTQSHRRLAKIPLGVSPVPKHPEIPSLCRSCGTSIKRKHGYCFRCSIEVSKSALVEAARHGRIATQTPEVRSRRGQKQSQHRRAELTWDPKSQPSWLTKSFYLERIQPRLADLTVSSIALALDFSIPYASEVRAGRDRPHPRHWLTLAQLVKLNLD